MIPNSSLDLDQPDIMHYQGGLLTLPMGQESQDKITEGLACLEGVVGFEWKDGTSNQPHYPLAVKKSPAYHWDHPCGGHEHSLNISIIKLISG